jgi:polar amino acid transport system permease protein
MLFDLSLAIAILPDLLSATRVTISVTVISFLLAGILGLPLMLLRRSGVRPVAAATRFVIDFVRGTPLLVQIYFVFFVLPERGVVLPPLTTGVLALSIHYGCYIAEVYRAGLEAIPKGQWDAITALGLSRVDGYRYIILPQLLPPVVPSAGNFLIAMFKETPLLASISVTELMFVARGIGMNTFQYLEPMTLCGLLFLVMSLGGAACMRIIEVRLGRPWFGSRHSRVA